MAATIGEQLRLTREERGIPLREVSDETRISIHYLEAIESNDYKHLPGGIFNRSFVKAYARSVGFDEKEAVEAYTRYMREQSEAGAFRFSLPGAAPGPSGPLRVLGAPRRRRRVRRVECGRRAARHPSGPPGEHLWRWCSSWR